MTSIVFVIARSVPKRNVCKTSIMDARSGRSDMFEEIDSFGTTRSFRSGMLVSLRWSEILFRVRCYKHFAPTGARRVQGLGDFALQYHIIRAARRHQQLERPSYADTA